MVALLCAKYTGSKPDYWAWQCSIDQAYERLDRACEGLPSDKQPDGPSWHAMADFHSLTNHIKGEMLKASAA